MGADLVTSGQPTEAQLADVAAAGYAVVVNLATYGSPTTLPDERATVEGLGMAYIHIPVIWENPTPADLDTFFATLDRLAGRRVIVHCVANMRVSAFIFLYRVLRLGWRPDAALPDLHAIWTPDGQWAVFIEAALARQEGC